MPVNNDLQFTLSVHNGQFNAAMTAAGQTLNVFNGQLKTVNGSLAVTEQSMLEAGAASLQLQANISAFGNVASGIFASASQGFREYETAIANLRKVTGQLTDENLPALSDALTKISATLPNTRVELLEIGTALSQLGFFAKDTENTIVPSMERIIELVGKVAIATDLSATEAGNSFGVLKNIFLDSNITVGETVNKLKEFADVANALSNTTAATAGFVIRFNSIVGATAKAAGLGFNEVAGFGAAVANLGKTADVAGTAIQQLFLKATLRADAFGKALGISGVEFKKQFAAKPNETIIRFFEALNKATSERRSELLASIGLESRATTILQGLANNINLVKDAQLTANKAAAEGVSLDNEVEVRLKTLQVQYDLLANGVQRVISDGFKPFAAAILPVINSINEFIKANPQLVSVFGTVGVALAGILAAISGVALAFVGLRIAVAGVGQAFKSITGSIAGYYTATTTADRATIRAAANAQLLADQLRRMGPAYATAAAEAQKYADKQKTAAAATKGFVRGVAAIGTVGLGAVTALAGEAVSKLTNDLADVKSALEDVGKAGGGNIGEMTKAVETGREALAQFNGSIGGMIANTLTLGAINRRAQADLDAVAESAANAEKEYVALYERIANPPKAAATEELQKLQDAKKDIIADIRQGLGGSADAAAQSIVLLNGLFNKTGEDGVAALREVQKATNLTEKQTLALAQRVDDLKGRAKGATGTLVAGLTKAATAAAQVSAETKILADLNDRLKADASAISKQRDDDAKAAVEAGRAQRLINNEGLAQVQREQAAARIRRSAEEKINDLKRQQVLAQEQLSDPTIAADLEKRKQLQDSIPRLIREQEEIERGLEEAVRKTLAAESEYAVKLRESQSALDENKNTALERKAAELDFLASVAATERAATSLRRQAMNLRLAIVQAEFDARKEALDREAKTLYGEGFKANKIYLNKLENLEADSLDKRARINDAFQQERIKSILDANKELTDAIKSNAGVGSKGLVDADSSVKAIRQIKEEIATVATSLADPEKRLARIKQLQNDINKIVTESGKRYRDAQNAVIDLENSIKDQKAAEKLKVEETRTQGNLGILDATESASKRRQSGEISKREAAAEIAAAQRKGAIEVEAAKRKQKQEQALTKAMQDQVLTDKERKALDDQRIKDNKEILAAKIKELEINAKQSGQLGTKAGREQLAVQKERLRQEFEIDEKRRQANDDLTKEARAQYDDSVRLAELQKEAADSQANLVEVTKLQAELEKSRITNIEGVLLKEQQVTAERQKQYDLAVKMAATPNAGNTPAQGSNPQTPGASAPRAAAPPTPTTATPQGLPANFATALAGVTDSTAQLTASLSAAGNAIVNAATTLKTTSDQVGTNIKAFTDKTTSALTEVSASLKELNTKVSKATTDIANIQSSITAVKG